MVGLVAVLSGLACSAPFADAATKHAATSVAAATETVALKAEGGELLVPVVINDSVKLDFMLDSGASVVTIPADVAMTLIRTGTLTRDDYLGRETFQLADGAPCLRRSCASAPSRSAPSWSTTSRRR
jgi:hypothetical protein